MLYKYIPYSLFKRFFGDRKKYGSKICPEDEDYKKWQKNYVKFYTEVQKGSIGKIVNHYGFRIMKHLDLSGNNILELGPGVIEHLDYNITRPAQYYIADTSSYFLDISEKKLNSYGVSNIHKILITDESIPLPSKTIDIVLSFHQLEHIYQLPEYVKEIKRVLKPGGLLAGAVPCEGGLAWGFGRFLVSRRYVFRNMNFNYDKIICWEHPNFLDSIKHVLDDTFTPILSIKKPFRFLPADFNLSWAFLYRK